MMRKQLFIRFLFLVVGKVFNVGDSGQKTRYDKLTNNVYGFASSENVKKCMKNLFVRLIESTLPQMYFTKKSEENETDGEQGGMFTRFDVNDLITPIFGGWHSELKNDKDELGKYTKFAVSSCFTLDSMAPLHPLLQTLTNEDTGVCVGNEETSSIVIKKKVEVKKGDKTKKEEKLFFKPEDGVTVDDFSKRPMNLYKTPKYCNGLYTENVSIDIERFGLYDLNEFQPTEEVKKWLLEECGWEEKKIGNKNYIGPRLEIRKQLFHKFCEMLTEWKFETNNSTNGGRCELLRCSASLNANHLNASTMGTLVSEDKAQLKLRDIDDVESFNLPTLEQVLPNVETDVYAAEHFVEYLKTLDQYIQ